MPKEDTQFSSTNQPKKRGKGKKSLMLDAIRSVCGDEKEFLEQVVSIGLGGAVVTGKDDEGEDIIEHKSPNPVLLNLVLNRIEPPLKATSPTVNFEFNEKDKPHEQAAQVLSAMASGGLAPDIGNMFVQSIKAMIDIEEHTDLKERIQALEEKLGIV